MTHPPQYIGTPGAVGNYVVQYECPHTGVWLNFPAESEYTSLASAEQAAVWLKACPSYFNFEIRVVRRQENGISQGLFTA